MVKVVTVAQMRAIEAGTDRDGTTYAMMMEAAGQAVAQAVLARLDKPAEQRGVVLCGKGNNGGDGLVAAYYLAEAGLPVAVYFPSPPDENNPNLQRVRAKGLLVADGENDPRWRVLEHSLKSATVLIDALFGTGARLPLSGSPAELLRQTARLLPKRPAGRPLLHVAVDCPSGLDCDSGALDATTLPADLTVTFAAAKPGQFVFPAADLVGQLIIADIGVPHDLPEFKAVQTELGTRATVQALLPPRPRAAHKGTFGRALLVAGSVPYTGAAYLAGAAAYRLGAGLVTLAVPAPLHPILAAHLPEATWLPLAHVDGFIAATAGQALLPELPRTQALGLGPGLGTHAETQAFMQNWLTPENSRSLPPLVIDADGLRLLAQLADWPHRLPRQTVLTPHPGEMAGLTGLSKAAIQADRVNLARKFAAEWGQVVVLKGAFTVVAAPDGRATLQPFATAALARAGTGDVLTGAICGLLAQGLAPYAAAVAATYLHGRAGELAAAAAGNTASVLAGEVLRALPQVLTETGCP